MDKAVDDLGRRLPQVHSDDGHARSVVTRMAYLLQAGQMLEHSPQAAADMFIRAQLGVS